MAREYRGGVIYEERPAPPEVADAVTRLWFLEAEPTRRFEKILPMPFVHVIVNLSDLYRLFDSRGVSTVVADAFVSGLQSEYLVIESPHPIRHVGMELAPAGLHTMAPDAAGMSAGKVQDARAVLTEIDALVDPVRASTAPSGALDALAEFAKGARVGEPDTLVQAALDAIDDDPDVRIGALAERLGVAHRTFVTRFRAVTGTTPKQHAQVVRFHRFVDTAEGVVGAPDWARLAAASGYYDQPHVIRAFRRFSGWTPAEYHRVVAEHGPDAAHFVPLEQVPVQAAPTPASPR